METSQTQDWEEKQPGYADDNQTGHLVKAKKKKHKIKKVPDWFQQEHFLSPHLLDT